jgi:hypothetical protein
MSEFTNIQIAEKLFEAINAHDLNLGERYQTVDYRYEGPGTNHNGGALNRDQAREYIQGFINGFPDLHFEMKTENRPGEFVVMVT